MVLTQRKMKVEYFHKDRLVAIIRVDYAKDLIEVENFTDKIWEKPFGRLEPTFEGLEDFFEDHIIDRNRRDIKEILKYHGLDFYDPELIARISHGRTCDDYYWMRFDDENITWEEVKGYDYRENR